MLSSKFNVFREQCTSIGVSKYHVTKIYYVGKLKKSPKFQILWNNTTWNFGLTFFTWLKFSPLTLAWQVQFDFQNFFSTKLCNFSILDLPSKHSGTKLKINFSQRREKSIPFSYLRAKWTSDKHCKYELCARFSKTLSLFALMILKATNNVNFIGCSRTVMLGPSVEMCDKKRKQNLRSVGSVLMILRRSEQKRGVRGFTPDSVQTFWWMNTTVTLRLTSSLTKTVHFNIETFLESASLTLVSPFFIHDAVSISFTWIYHVSPHASHEKSTATIAGIHSIMPTRRNILANFTKYLRLSFQRRFEFLRRRGFSVHVLVFCRN